MVETRHDRPAETGRAEPPQTGPPPSLPAVIPAAQPRRRRPRWLFLLLFVVLGVAAAIGYQWLRQAQNALPPGIFSGNGRLEADQIDIDTKFAGRIAKLLVDQGDLVKAGQVVAVMDTRDLEARLKQYRQLVLQSQHALAEAEKNLAQQQNQLLSSEAAVQQAQHAVSEATANLQQQNAQVKLAKQEFERTSYLVPKGYASVELLDQRRQRMDAAVAAQNAASAKVGEAEQALAAARHNAAAATAARDAAAARVDEAQHAIQVAAHEAEYYEVNIADNTLVAPRSGPIEYRVANVGEVLPAGGKVFTMLDAGYIYMDIYLPTVQAGRVRIGDDARIVLDAYLNHVIPARVVFIASQSQFTPKTVETKEEREKLMFRIRVRIDPARLKGREAIARTGLPGVAYVRTDPRTAWPVKLQASPPPTVPPTVPPQG